MYRVSSVSLRAAAVVGCAVAGVSVAGVSGAAAQDAGGAAPLPPVVVQSVTPKASPKKAKVAKKKSSPTAPGPVAAAPKSGGPQSGANALGTYNPALDLPGLELPPGTVITTAGPVYGYQALSAFSSTKTATPIEQIPQSIQVIPKSLLEDQTSLTIKEAVQNASNVTGQNSYSLGDDTTNIGVHKVRGLYAEQWLDGLMVPNNAGDLSSFANVERIEVLKGPSAILYGGGVGAPIAGAINIVSKLPTNIASAEAGITFGSHSFAQPYFDINQPLAKNGTVLFRLTGEYTSTDSFVEVLERDSYSINPTVTFTDKSDTTLTIQGRASRVKQQTYQGLPATGTLVGSFRTDPALFIGPSDIPRGYSEVQGVTATLDHRFDSIWSANVKARWSQSESDQKTQVAAGASFADGYATPAIPPSTWFLNNAELYQEEEERTVAGTLQAKFNTGNTRNVFLVGGDYSRVRHEGFFDADAFLDADGDFFPDFVDLAQPVFSSPYFDPDPATSLFYFPFNNSKDVFTTKGIYAQLQTSLYDRIHFLGGVRLANVNIDHYEALLPLKTVTDETKLLPRAGVVVDLLPWLSPYASYSEGMKAVSSLNLVQAPKPEETLQREAGVKLQFNNQLSGTISVFEIERDNIPVSAGFAVAYLSNQISRGYEADLIWQPTRNWQFLANYGRADVKFASDYGTVAAGTFVPAGNKVPGVPEHSGRIWANYRFDDPMLKGWSLGAGVYLASDQFVDSANVYRTDGYYTVDAKVGYQTETFVATFNVKNLTGEEYFVPYSFFGGQVAPGDDRAYYGTLVYKY